MKETRKRTLVRAGYTTSSPVLALCEGDKVEYFETPKGFSDEDFAGAMEALQQGTVPPSLRGIAPEPGWAPRSIVGGPDGARSRVLCPTRARGAHSSVVVTHKQGRKLTCVVVERHTGLGLCQVNSLTKAKEIHRAVEEFVDSRPALQAELDQCELGEPPNMRSREVRQDFTELGVLIRGKLGEGQGDE